MSGSCVPQKTPQPLPPAPPQLRGLIACVQGHLWYSAAVWSWSRLQGKEQYEKELWEASSSHFAWEPYLSWGLHPCTLQNYVAGKSAPDWLDFLAWRQTSLIIMGLLASHSTLGWPWLTSPDHSAFFPQVVGEPQPLWVRSQPSTCLAVNLRSPSLAEQPALAASWREKNHIRNWLYDSYFL